MSIVRCRYPPSYLLPFLFLQAPGHPRHLRPFPTRRSSDLATAACSAGRSAEASRVPPPPIEWPITASRVLSTRARDRKSTRLNSSHVEISYAVFCLKKKKTTEKNKIHDI